MGWFGLHFRAQREKPSILIGLKLKNSKIRKNGPPGAHGPPGLGRGWPHNPPLGPMGPHGSFMVAPLFNDEAAKSRYGAQWAPQGSPKSRARRQNSKKFGPNGPPGAPPRSNPSTRDSPWDPPATASRAFPQCCAVAGLLTRRGGGFLYDTKILHEFTGFCLIF